MPKLARKPASRPRSLQLCFYADAVEALTGANTADLDASFRLGSRVRETLNVNEFGPLLEAAARAARNRPCWGHRRAPSLNMRCTGFCEFSARCEQRWRRDFVAVRWLGIRKTRPICTQCGRRRARGQLAEHDGPCATVEPETPFPVG